MKHIVIDARIRQSSTGRPVDRLLEHLQHVDNTHQYTVIVTEKDDWKPTAKNFSVQKSRYPIFSFNPLNQLLFAGQLNRLKADLVHFTLTPQQPRLYLKPFTTFTHDLGMLKYARAGNLPEILHKLRMRGYKYLLTDAHNRAKRVIVPTQFVADDVNKYHLQTNRKTVVATEASEPPLGTKATVPKNPPEQFIMYTGSAFPHKNLERLISAYHLLKKQHPELRLVLVGKREKYNKQLERWASKHDMKNGITFTGFIPDEELKWYYHNAKAYVFASLSEGFGLPGLEAMAHGCPVVSSNTSCLPEVHGDAAQYFDPEDVQEMSDAINSVISDEKRRTQLIKKGYKNIQRFSWQSFAMKHLEVFKEVLAETKGDKGA